MARKRIDLGGAEDRIVELRLKGWTAERIAGELARQGRDVSVSTVTRRMRELGGKVKAQKVDRARVRASAATGATPPLPSAPDEIPEGTDLATLDRWLETAERMGRMAEDEGDLGALAAAARVSAALLEAKRKATPPKAPDPNENPDMMTLAAEVRTKLHRMVEQVAP